jgi:hypothetical protein
MLDDAYLREAEYRARRFSGAYTGTSGALAADVIRLLNYCAELKKGNDMEWQEGAAAIRSAVESRNAARESDAGGCCDGGRMCQPEVSALPQQPEPIADRLESKWDADWILRGAAELERQRAGDEPRLTGDGILNAADDLPEAERLLLAALDVIRDRRPKYGGPKAHFGRTVGMINAAFADVLKRPLTPADWAIFIMLDKLGRYCGAGQKTADGPIDLAGYAACLAECEKP